MCACPGKRQGRTLEWKGVVSRFLFSSSSFIYGFAVLIVAWDSVLMPKHGAVFIFGRFAFFVRQGGTCL